MPEQKVTSLGKATARANARAKGYLPGQSHRSSKCQSKRLPPWAKPPLEQMPEQKVTSLGKATARANARAKGYLPGQSHRSSKCQSKRLPPRSKERRVGKECRSRRSPDH